MSLSRSATLRLLRSDELEFLFLQALSHLPLRLVLAGKRCHWDGRKRDQCHGGDEVFHSSISLLAVD